MAKPFKRLIWLIQTIQSVGSISYEELCRKWTYSSINDNGESRIPRRTLQNQIQDIDKEFGIKIRCRRSDGHYYIDDSYSCQEVFSPFIDFIISIARRNDKILQERIHIADSRVNNRNIPLIAAAIKESRVIRLKAGVPGCFDDEKDLPFFEAKYPGVDVAEILHQGFNTFSIYPYYLDYCTMSSDWYLIGYVPERDRIEVHSSLTNVSLTNDYFVLPEGLSLKQIREDHFLWVREKDWDLYDRRIDYSSWFYLWDTHEFSDDEEERIKVFQNS